MLGLGLGLVLSLSPVDLGFRFLSPAHGPVWCLEVAVVAEWMSLVPSLIQGLGICACGMMGCSQSYSGFQ